MENENTPNGNDQKATLYLVIATAFSFLWAILLNEVEFKHEMHQLGFWIRVFMFFVGIPGGYFGLKIGRAVRDSIGRQAADLSVLWILAPQPVGLLIGWAIGVAILFYIAL